MSSGFHEELAMNSSAELLDILNGSKGPFTIDHVKKLLFQGAEVEFPDTVNSSKASHLFHLFNKGMWADSNETPRMATTVLQVLDIMLQAGKDPTTKLQVGGRWKDVYAWMHEDQGTSETDLVRNEFKKEFMSRCEEAIKNWKPVGEPLVSPSIIFPPLMRST